MLSNMSLSVTVYQEWLVRPIRAWRGSCRCWRHSAQLGVRIVPDSDAQGDTEFYHEWHGYANSHSS